MSSPCHFDALVYAYLDGDASPEQVVALRDAMRSDPELRARIVALIRLHRAQSVVLGRPRVTPFTHALVGLRRFADRAGRCLAHTCLLALVFVELDVAVPGVDMSAWVESELIVLTDLNDTEGMEFALPPEPITEEELGPMPDVREADFLES